MSKTVEQYVQMMLADPNTRRSVPEELHEDPQIQAACRKIVLEDTALLYWEKVPWSMLSEETCIEVVETEESGSEVLEYIPSGWRTRAVCEAAIKRNCDNMRYVPFGTWDQELLDMAFRTDPAEASSSMFFSHVPDHLFSDWICDTIIAHCPEELQDLPKERRTLERCLDAVKRRGVMLKAVPRNLMTEEVCLAAVGEDGAALEYVPDELRTRAVCEAALNSKTLAWCPPRERASKEFYYERDPLLGDRDWRRHPLTHIPEEILTEEMCLAAVTRAGQALYHVPEKFRTPRVCEAAVRNDPAAIEDVPEALRTEELISLSQQAKHSQAA